MDSVLVEGERIKRAKQRIDYARPGALDAYAAVRQNPQATAEEWEKLANSFPLTFHRSAPATEAMFEHSLKALQAKHDKLGLAIHAGADINHETAPRMTTGCLALDYCLNGGVPRGFVGQIKGAENLGKTFIALKTCAEIIMRGGHAIWMAAERFDKGWARTCGIPIPFSKAEIYGAPLRNMPPMPPDQQALALAYNAAHPEGRNFVIMVGEKGNELLQAVLDATKQNVYDLIVIDSIAVLQKEARLAKQVGTESPGGEAKMFNDFCAKSESAFNTVEANYGKVLGTTYTCRCGLQVDKKADQHKVCADGQKSDWNKIELIGEALRTGILAINQLRDRGIMSHIQQKPDAGGGRGLRHAKGYDIEFQRAERLSTDYEGRPVVYGQNTIVQVVKSKIGPSDRTCVVQFVTNTIPGVCTAGQYNFLVDLIGVRFKEDEKIMGIGEMAGLIKQSGPYYYVGNERFQGQANLIKYLAAPENEHIRYLLRNAILEWIQRGAV